MVMSQTSKMADMILLNGCNELTQGKATKGTKRKTAKNRVWSICPHRQ